MSTGVAPATAPTDEPRSHGGPGPDFLAGQVGNDTLNGGLGVDKCFQGTGDVMIAEVVDTNGTGMVDNGDTINMGQYPTRTDAVIRETMEDWPVRSHPVTSSDQSASLDITQVQSGARLFEFHQISPTNDFDSYFESHGAPPQSIIGDNKSAGVDFDYAPYRLGSPSMPIETLELDGDSTGDDGFIDVEIYVP